MLYESFPENNEVLFKYSVFIPNKCAIEDLGIEYLKTSPLDKNMVSILLLKSTLLSWFSY